MSRLSAALIVRDESKFIEGCLDSLVGRVDEIIVVDTGSSDDTLDRALRFPIRLHHFPWSGDFSAARNFALERASGDWILYIDADERFRVHDLTVLRSALADTGKVAWSLRFFPRVDWTPYAELRLFRNDPRIRFQGIIHERVHEAVESIVRAEDRETGHCSLEIHHLGYEDDQTRKNPRNIPLLRRRLKREPTHLYFWWHLGQSLSLAGDEEGALAAWGRGMALARLVPKSKRRLSDAQSIVSLLKLQIKRGALVESLLREAIELYPQHLALRWIEATILLKEGELIRAKSILEMLASIDAETFFDPYISYEKALFRYLAKEALALCLFRMGHYKEAAKLYRLAAETSPDRLACETKARLAEQKAAA
jgi:glycosyltransferase involved in cell wall biosynthesis